MRDAARSVYSEAVIEDAALTFVRANRDRPFFLYFATQLPHGPVIVDALGSLFERPEYPTTAHREWAAMVARLDTFVGKLVRTMDEIGIRERTVIAFASDNGYSMCGYFARGNQSAGWPDDPFFRNKGPFRGGKFSVREGGLRIPFFVHAGSMASRAVVSKPVWLVDLMPTFAELAGTQPEAEGDGTSLVPLLTGNTAGFPADRPLYWEKARAQAVRQGPWKAYRPAPDQPTELYLIEEDAGSERDLSSSYPGVVAAMERTMEREHVDHPWYWNPQESAEDYLRKQERAAELGQLQVAR